MRFTVQDVHDICICCRAFWPPLAGRWIKVNIVAALLVVAASMGLYGMEQFSAQTGVSATVINFVAAVLLFSLVGVAAGMLTGAVLQRMLTLLPLRTWVALYAAIGAGFGIAYEIKRIIWTDGLSYEWSNEAIFLLYGAYGCLWGAVVGGLEALVLRTAARGVVP